MKLLLAGVVAVGLISRVSAAQAPPEFSREFDRVDREARQVTEHLRCVTVLRHLARTGVVTTADSSNAFLVCVPLRGRMVGLFVNVDSSWKRFTKFAAFDLSRRERITDAVDTAEVFMLTMAQSRATWAMKDTITQFLPPVTIRADSTIRVLFIPGAILPNPTPQIGGEHLFVISADARKILRVDSVPPMKPVTPPAGSSRAWTIETGTESVPTFSEMLLANMLSMDGQAVTFAMKTRVAHLVGDFSTAVWIFMPRKP